ncbi:eukaryotic translation initiation factor 2-alpha kinase 1-like isoform X2 [Ornithodoros turicata]|uniref:eukaryotic translation initiation factor 2-alpha kinase 1-like isoform X2 n=1 Tax=Ornithodoros turicata TaxID=34597 RepID=UPI00313A001A
MASNDLPRRTARTCANIDAPSRGISAPPGEVSTGGTVHANGPLAVPTRYTSARPEHIPYNLLLESLIEQLCNFYEPNPDRRRQLFKGICQRLGQYHLFEHFPNIQELYHLRFKFRHAFSRLVIEVKTSLPNSAILDEEHKSLVPYSTSLANGQSPFRLSDPVGDLALIHLDEVTCQQNRCQYDFEEIEKIAEGGFGIVCKAKKRVDSCVYAIKMIPFKYSNRDLLQRILKEVELLAQLCHPNIVAYKTAWIENQVPIIAVQRNSSENTSSDTSSAASCINKGTAEDLSCSCPNGNTHLSKKSGSFSRCACVNGVRVEESYIVFQEASQTTTSATVECISCTAPLTASGSVRNARTNSKSDCGVPKVQQDNGKASSNGSNCHLQPVMPAKDLLFQLLTEAKVGATLFIQMELCSGNLADWISARNMRLSSSPDSTYIDDALNIFKQILKGVQYIHAEGVIHRDLKPHNIMFDGKGSRVKIGDFGLATMSNIDRGSDPHRHPWIRARLHTQGVGTDLYAAPEQRDGGLYDSKADIFSLGIILTELVHPFTTGHERITTLKLLRDGFVPVPVALKCQEVANMILRMCKRDPVQRPTAAEILMSTLFKTKDELLTSLRGDLLRKEQEVTELNVLLKKKCAELEWYQANCHCRAQW